MKKLIFSFFLFLFFLLSIFASGTVDSQDGQLYLAVARYIYYTGEPTAPPYEFNFEGTGKNIHMGTYKGRDGKTYSPTGLGFSLALLPAVAGEDLIYRYYGKRPQLEHFPLENDWPVLFFASLTNSFFGALLGVVLFLYLLELGLNKRDSLLITLVSLLGTNLWPYTKHSFAHMMFLAFLVLTFYLIKIFSRTRKKQALVFAGISFGICAITYNQSFTLSLPALGIYYFILTKARFSKSYFIKALKDFSLFCLPFLPFLAIFAWFEILRFREWTYMGNETFIRQYAVFKHVPVSVFIEGIYGQLFSPGRSFFLYSPVILMVIFFRHKIKQLRPEVIVFLILSFIYLIFFASLYVVEEPQYGARGLWDGELSWGPRYLLTLIPFGMLITGVIYKNLSKIQRIFCFWPLIFIGFYINFLGIFLPYQLKLHNLEPELYLNGQKYTSFSYSNLFPRYTPVLSMSKELAGHLKTFPKTLDHGKYNVRFFYGVDFPFQAGSERWRVIERQGYVGFDNMDKDIRSLSLSLINQPVKEASSSALLVSFVLNNTRLEQTVKLAAAERATIIIPAQKDLLKEKGNILEIIPLFENPLVFNDKSQIMGLLSFSVNDTAVNMESLDFPYVSGLGRAFGEQDYATYGKDISDPWKIWDIHTQIYERTPDFWWIKPFYYWDLPRRLFLLLFLSNLFCLIYFGQKVFTQVKK